MARVESPRVSSHGDQARFLLRLKQTFGILQAIGDRNLDHHVLTGAHALNALIGMHLGRRSQDRRFHARLGQALRQIACPMGNVESLRHLFCLDRISAGQRYHFDAVNVRDCLQVLDAKRTLSGNAYFHRFPSNEFVFIQPF